MRTSLDDNTSFPWLPALGALSVVGYGFAALGLSGHGADVPHFLALLSALFAVYVLALGLAHRSSGSGSVRQILIWAVLFRLMLLPAGLPPASWTEGLRADFTSEAVGYRTFLLYDNDVWRYFWDGHVASHGFNPYVDTPAALEARADEEDPRAELLFEEELWQDVFDNTSFHLYRSVYPPLAELLFRVLHETFPGSVLVFKLVLVLFDVGTCLLLVSLLRRFGRPASAVLIYAWNPLVIKEIAGSGHIDAMMIFFLVLAIHLCLGGRPGLGSRPWAPRAGLVALGLAILSKLTPVLLVGLFLRRTRFRDWPALAFVLLAGYLPYLTSWPEILRGIAAFSKEWVFNPGPWALWKWLAEMLSLPGRETAGLVSGLLTLTLIGWVLLRDDGSDHALVGGAFVILGGYLVLSATVMPWYLLWVLPMAAVRPGYAWIALTWLSLLSYLIYIDQIERPWWLWTEFVVFFGILAWERMRVRRDLEFDERCGV